MKARHAMIVALAAAFVLTSVAAAGPEAAKQRVAISMKGLANGTFVLTPLQAGTLKRDSGTVSVVYSDPSAVMREGQTVYIYRNTYTLQGKRGSMSIRERNEWVDVSNENAPGFDFPPRCRHRHVEGRGRDGHVRQDHRRRTEWPRRHGCAVARTPGGLPHSPLSGCTRRAARARAPLRLSRV